MPPAPQDPLNYLSMPDLKARAKQDDVDFKGLGKADLVKAVRAAIGGAAPVKIRKEPMDEWTATELKEVRPRRRWARCSPPVWRAAVG